MTSWIFAGITAFVYLIQTTILCKLTVFGVMPDAVLVCVLCYSIVFGREKGFIAAFIVGVLMDFFAGVFFGRHIIIYLLSTALASVLSENTFGKNFVTAAIINFVVSLLGAVTMAIYLYITKLDRNIAYSMFVVAPIYGIYNMFVGIFIYIFMENLKTFSYWRE